MKQNIVVFMSAILLSLSIAHPAYATFPMVSDASAMSFGDLVNFQPDSRSDRLRAYLASHDSPLTSYAHIFVSEADEHGLDWRLVAAIAGTESTFGKHIPAGSYNCWGWGIPTGAQWGVAFNNFENGIKTVSEGLEKNYVQKGAVTIEQIGYIYAASPAWAGHVRFFVEEIENFTPANPELLDITI
jgi:hypothetical protein